MFSSQIIIDADMTETGWEIALRFGPDDCVGSWSGVGEEQLVDLVGPHAATALTEARDNGSA